MIIVIDENKETYACLIGAEVDYDDVTLNRFFTSENGTGSSSLIHFNGIARRF